jgi:hypothetical protein
MKLNDKEQVFWCAFEEVSNNGLADYDKLYQRLISTGKFNVGDADLMIEYMQKSGKIERIEELCIVKSCVI